MAYQSISPYDGKVVKSFQILSDDDFARLATLEMGKLIEEARGEVMLSADILDYYAKNAECFLAPEKLSPSD